MDREVPLFLRMFEKRLRGYRAIGSARDTTVPGFDREQERDESYLAGGEETNESGKAEDRVRRPARARKRRRTTTRP